MKQFVAVVHTDAGSAFGVHFPDLPGCFSAADTFDDVRPNAVEALSLYVEDAPMVEPRPLETVRADAARDLAEGAVLMTVPCG
jgi:predicted RNase H-like HicB family nuclease